MKRTKTVQVPATTREVVDSITCDFCGATLEDFATVFSEVQLEHNEGSRFPDGGSGTKTIFDCCDKCWSDKVMPALIKLGATPRTEEWDF